MFDENTAMVDKISLYIRNEQKIQSFLFFDKIKSKKLRIAYYGIKNCGIKC